MTTKKFYEPSEISVADFKKNLAKLEEKITKILVPWKCHSCGANNTKNGFYCETCGTRNIATYG